MYGTHRYVDEVENYEWRLHGNLIAYVKGGRLVLDACRHHTNLTLDRMYMLIKYGPLEHSYRVVKDRFLCLVKLSPTPRPHYPLTRPVAVDLSSGEVVEGPRPFYIIDQPKRQKVSFGNYPYGKFVYVRTTADVDVVRRVTGLNSVNSRRVTIAVNTENGDVYLRPAGHKLNWWYKLTKGETKALLESIRERDRWIFEGLDSNPQNIMKAWHVYLLAS
ncbi:MAG: hypothetical protein QXX25_03105 [Thermofilaceae archaeon]